ncbi:MAG: hypothetical protein LH610_09690 [Sphingomonas bacterium]|nr:hypothetical protein [Sphingomonas bacterium]
MRSFLYLLALFALLGAPLAAPATAMTMAMTMTGAARQSAADCADMAMDRSGHEMPTGDHGKGKACCIAVPPAIDPPVVALDTVPGIEHLAFVATNVPFRLGAGPKAEDPPPRIA